jgi:hypothetical protein
MKIELQRCFQSIGELIMTVRQAIVLVKIADLGIIRLQYVLFSWGERDASVCFWPFADILIKISRLPPLNFACKDQYMLTLLHAMFTCKTISLICYCAKSAKRGLRQFSFLMRSMHQYWLADGSTTNE